MTGATLLAGMGQAWKQRRKQVAGIACRPPLRQPWRALKRGLDLQMT